MVKHGALSKSQVYQLRRLLRAPRAATRRRRRR